MRLNRTWKAAFRLALICGLCQAAAAQDDISGSYSVEAISEDSGGAGLSLVVGDGRVLLYYDASFPSGQTTNTCVCHAAGKAAGNGLFRFEDAETHFAGTLQLTADKLELSMSEMGCCGLNAPGRQAFPRRTRLALVSCTVKSPKSQFLSLADASKPAKGYLVAGDKLEATEPEGIDDTVLARYAGKKVSLGRLAVADLDCPAQP